MDTPYPALYSNSPGWPSVPIVRTGGLVGVATRDQRLFSTPPSTRPPLPDGGLCRIWDNRVVSFWPVSWPASSLTFRIPPPPSAAFRQSPRVIHRNTETMPCCTLHTTQYYLLYNKGAPWKIISTRIMTSYLPCIIYYYYTTAISYKHYYVTGMYAILLLLFA